jgi:hypothetical protein
VNQEELIAQIVEKSAAAVEARLAAKQTEDEKAPEEPKEEDASYWFQIQRRWWFPKTYKIKSHAFATHEWLQNPVSGDPALVPAMHALVLDLVDGSRVIIPSLKAKQYRIWR